MCAPTPKCPHCGHEGRMATIVDSEGRACQLRITTGSRKKKQQEYVDFCVCPECKRINER